MKKLPFILLRTEYSNATIRVVAYNQSSDIESPKINYTVEEYDGLDSLGHERWNETFRLEERQDVVLTQIFLFRILEDLRITKEEKEQLKNEIDQRYSDNIKNNPPTDGIADLEALLCGLINLLNFKKFANITHPIFTLALQQIKNGIGEDYTKDLEV